MPAEAIAGFLHGGGELVSRRCRPGRWRRSHQRQRHKLHVGEQAIAAQPPPVDVSPPRAAQPRAVRRRARAVRPGGGCSVRDGRQALREPVSRGHVSKKLADEGEGGGHVGGIGFDHFGDRVVEQHMPAVQMAGFGIVDGLGGVDRLARRPRACRGVNALADIGDGFFDSGSVDSDSSPHPCSRRKVSPAGEARACRLAGLQTPAGASPAPARRAMCSQGHAAQRGEQHRPQEVGPIPLRA